MHLRLPRHNLLHRETFDLRGRDWKGLALSDVIQCGSKPLTTDQRGLFFAAMADPRGGKWNFFIRESCKETHFPPKQHHEEQALDTEHTTKQQANSLAPQKCLRRTSNARKSRFPTMLRTATLATLPKRQWMSSWLVWTFTENLSLKMVLVFLERFRSR